MPVHRVAGVPDAKLVRSGRNARVQSTAPPIGSVRGRVDGLVWENASLDHALRELQDRIADLLQGHPPVFDLDASSHFSDKLSAGGTRQEIILPSRVIWHKHGHLPTLMPVIKES